MSTSKTQYKYTHLIRDSKTRKLLDAQVHLPMTFPCNHTFSAESQKSKSKNCPLCHKAGPSKLNIVLLDALEFGVIGRYCQDHPQKKITGFNPCTQMLGCELCYEPEEFDKNCSFVYEQLTKLNN